jgi:hypothetical protein
VRCRSFGTGQRGTGHSGIGFGSGQRGASFGGGKFSLEPRQFRLLNRL